MSIDWTLVVEAIKALAWPLVAAFALYLLRRPLIQLVAEVARRARKVSIFEVSVELATLPELSASWSVLNHDVRQLTPSRILDSFSKTLFEELLRSRHADFVIVDLGSGGEWLTSRLFIFAAILGEMTRLRAFVFLENTAGIRRRFLGVVTPPDVRRTLGMRYPWLEEAFARALASAYPNVPQPAKPGEPALSTFSNKGSPFAAAEDARQLVHNFVKELQRTTEPPAAERESYQSYLDAALTPAHTIWERAHWIGGERLERDLGSVLDYAWVEESPDTPRNLLSEAVMRRDKPLVALVDADRRFRGLVDRYVLLDQASIRHNAGGGVGDNAG